MKTSKTKLLTTVAAIPLALGLVVGGAVVGTMTGKSGVALASYDNPCAVKKAACAAKKAACAAKKACNPCAAKKAAIHVQLKRKRLVPPKKLAIRVQLKTLAIHVQLKRRKNLLMPVISLT